MGTLLVGLGLIVVLMLLMVGASRIYPKMTSKGGAEAEQELTGVGPESVKGEPDDKFMG